MELKSNSYNYISFYGYKLFASNIEDLNFNKKTLINTINQYSYCIAENDNKFKQSLLDSDILLPDGVGIVAAVRFLFNKKIKKIAGADLHDHFIAKLEMEQGSCFYLGSSNETLNKIKSKVQSSFPSISIQTYSPPFKEEFTEEENGKMIDAVNAFKPDVLFIGMTAPKQEKWAHENFASLNAKAICSIGAVFDFYAGTKNRPNEIWINSGFEWLGRLLKEPKRMWKRYIYYGPVFGLKLLKLKIKQFIN